MNLANILLPVYGSNEEAFAVVGAPGYAYISSKDMSVKVTTVPPPAMVPEATEPAPKPNYADSNSLVKCVEVDDGDSTYIVRLDEFDAGDWFEESDPGKTIEITYQELTLDAYVERMSSGQA